MAVYAPKPVAVDDKDLTPTARRLAAVYARYACFGHTEPVFRSKEFVKLIKEAGLETPSFNIRPPNRVDFVYTYACVHGPGGYRNNKVMSLEAFAYSTKGIAHELNRPHESVIAALEDCETPEDLAYTSSEGCAPPRACAILRAASPTLAPSSPQVHGAHAAAREPRLAEALRRDPRARCP